MEENTNEEIYTVDNSEENVDYEDPSSPVIYGVEDTPAPQLCVVFALQVHFYFYILLITLKLAKNLISFRTFKKKQQNK